MRRPAVDPLAVVAVVIALVMAGVYVGIMREQGDTPVPWFLAGLLVGAVAAGYGAIPAGPNRRAVLVLAAVVLVAMGVVAMLTIGFPILIAGALCAVAAMRSAGRDAAAPTREA